MLGQLPRDKKIILFDGLCNLCNSSVMKIIAYDKNNLFIFASLQSETGKKITDYLHINTTTTNSIILYEPALAYYTQSTAILKIVTEFGILWKTLQLFYIIPKTVRDICYNFIAKNRYRWFGKKDTCMIPTEDLTSKFLN